MKESSVVHSDPDILGGTPVFVRTRVPVQSFIDYIEGGHSWHGFLDDFPTVSRDVVVAALEQVTQIGGRLGSVSTAPTAPAPR
jgi:uncharacterized protein (DUF433 family)